MPAGTYVRTAEIKEKNRQTNLGKKHSPEVLLKLKISAEKRKLKSGYVPPMKGKKHTEETKESISFSLSGEKHPLFGKVGYWKNKKHSAFSVQKMRISQKGHKVSKETSCKIAEANKKRICTEESRLKRSLALRGKIRSARAKENYRKSAIKRIELNHGAVLPNYNLKACEYFKKFDEENNTQGR